MSVGEGWASTPSEFIAAFASPRMEMQSYFHGFYYRVTNDSETTWFHHGCCGQVDKSNTFYTGQVTYKADAIAKIFMKEIFKLHWLPRAIISDRDTKFTSNFWKRLFADLGTNLNFSIAYHPQTDGQTKRVNRVLEDMLRMYVMEKPTKWRIIYTW